MVLFVTVLLSYIAQAPFLYTNLKLQNTALQLCAGLPQIVSSHYPRHRCTGTVVESIAKTVSVTIAEKLLRIYLRHAKQCSKYLLKTAAKKRPNSVFGAFIRELLLSVLSSKSNSSASFPPLWTPSTLTFVLINPGREPKVHWSVPVWLQIVLNTF